jgi:hypothetical protein
MAKKRLKAKKTKKMPISVPLATFAAPPVVLFPKTAATKSLTVVGPLSMEQGVDLAAKLNGLIADYNTRFFLVNGVFTNPRISATTS